MMQFDFEHSDIPGVIEISPFYLADERGYFIKDFEQNVFIKNKLGTITFQEEFYSLSKKNVVRGIHFQLMYPQEKLVSCIRGRIFDVVVDLRKQSSTFGQWRSFELSEDNHKSLFIPKGCGHGFLSLEDSSIMSYKCQGYYHKEYDTGIHWNDESLDIQWPIADKENVIINTKDKNAMTFQSFIETYGGF